MYHYIVIDDEELTRKGTIAKLADLADLVNCVGEAGDGQEALDLIVRHNPDIIITDMNMPNMDGTYLLPILAEKYPEKPIIVISGYKNFEYTKHAIKAKAVDYLLKPFGEEEIQLSIKNAISTLNDTASVQNKLVSNETDKERAYYEYDIQSLKNTILGFHTEKLTFTSKKLSHMNHSYKLNLLTLHSKNQLAETEMQSYLHENGFGDLALYLQHNNNKHLGFLILFIPENAVLTPESLCIQVAKGLLHYFDSMKASISIGISNTHNELTHLNTAFSETVQALNTKKLCDNNQFYYYVKTESHPINLNWARTDELLFRIEAGMPEQVEILIDKLFKYFTTFTNATYADIKYYCFQLSDATRAIVANYIEKISINAVSSSTQNILNTMFDLSELKNFYMQFFTNIADILYDHGEYVTDDVIEKMQTYAQKNYSKNLTVDLLACFFNKNRSYLSHLFKEKTGVKFVDYLSDIRINKAKSLLATTDKKMYQIAKLIGYDNVKYFFRVFKKKTGKTPEQWRIHNRLK